MTTLETNRHNHVHLHLICWKSTLAGLALSLVVFAAFIALGAAFGGIVLSDGTTVARMTFLSALSLVLAVFLAAGAGGYYAVRLGKTPVDLLGCAQGALVGSLFLLFVICQGISAVGTLTKATGTLVGGTVGAAGAATQSPLVQEIIEDNMGELKFRSEGEVVVKGVAARLLRGDSESAKNYLAYQASLTPAEADQRVQLWKARAEEALVKAREAAAKALKVAGWGVFILIVTGLSAAVMGGLLGVKCNERYTLDTSDEEVQRIRALRA